MEAWEYGPAVPQLYHEVKRFGAVPIRDWSADFNYETREFTFPVVDDDDKPALSTLNLTWSLYGDLSVADLKKITHQPGGPWDRAMSRLQRTMPSRIPRTIPDKWIELEFYEILNELLGAIDLGTEEIVL